MPVEVFGRKVTCVHCGGEFRSEPTPSEPLPSHRLSAGHAGPTPALPLSFVTSCLPPVEAG